jgi:hypothetical protein
MGAVFSRGPARILVRRKELAKPSCRLYLGGVTNPDRIREAARSRVMRAYAGLLNDGLRSRADVAVANAWFAGIVSAPLGESFSPS